MALHIKQLCIGYKNGKKATTLVGPIDMKIKRGTLNAVVGLNGSGKTTLIKTIGQQIPKISGCSILDGIPLEQLSPKARAKQMSFVFTTPLPSENMTVYELVAMGRYPYLNWYGRLNKKDHYAINEALLFVNLKEIITKKYHQLSDGQKQKALIARALTQDTPYIFLDEPMAHLDLHHKGQLLTLLKDLVKTKGKTVFLSIHDIEMALSNADKILVLDKNKTHWGKANKLIAQGVFHALFPKTHIVFNPETKQFLYKE